jgi:hypothetical protein
MTRSLNECTLCHGDGWTADTYDYLEKCDQAEELRFMERMGVLGGAASGRMACPRCQPEWKPQ